MTRRNVNQKPGFIYSVQFLFILYLNDRFPFRFIYLSLKNPYPVIRLKTYKGTLFGWKLLTLFFVLPTSCVHRLFSIEHKSIATYLVTHAFTTSSGFEMPSVTV